MTNLAIKNLTHVLNNGKLAEVLAKNGVEVPEGATKGELVALARANGLWSYRGDVIKGDYKQRYGAAQRCGDEISEALNGATRSATGGVDLAALIEVQEANSIAHERWSHLNAGQQVMNTSNVLRGRVRRNEFVRIGGQTWGEQPETETKKGRKNRK